MLHSMPGSSARMERLSSRSLHRQNFMPVIDMLHRC